MAPEQIEANPLAALEDLRTRVKGGIGADDEARAEALLDDASDLVRDVADRPWTVEDAPRRAVKIVLEAARRAVVNPDGVAQESIGSYSYSLAQGTLPGVYLTQAEVDSLRRMGESSFRVATNVTPFSGPPLDECEYWWR